MSLGRTKKQSQAEETEGPTQLITKPAISHDLELVPSISQPVFISFHLLLNLPSGHFPIGFLTCFPYSSYMSSKIYLP
jgi:hypothetical protein